MKTMSKHNVDLVFHHCDVPLSDQTHGVYKMMPPDILHTIAEGVSKYIFESLQKQIGNTKAGKRAKTSVERVFLKIHRAISRNSERDLPRGSSNSGLLNSSRIWGWQRQGNVLRLLCLLHTNEARQVLEPLLNKNNASVEKMAEFLKLYLSMEAWLLGVNKKSEVHSSRAFIGHVIQLLQDLFPQGGDRAGIFPRFMVLHKFRPSSHFLGRPTISIPTPASPINVGW